MIRMMKIFLLSVCVLAVGTLTYAQGKETRKRCMAPNYGKGLCNMDQNRDGICDNQRFRGGRKGGKQGRRNVSDIPKGQGPRFVDKNADGVCDNLGSNQKTTE